MREFQSTPLRWAELSDYQQQTFGNGCGPAWFPNAATKLLFGWFFDASCRRHDFGYARGGDSRDRKRVDRGFYQAMLRDVNRLQGAKRLTARVMASVFYRLVRWFGWARFYYGPYRPLSYFFMTSEQV